MTEAAENEQNSYDDLRTNLENTNDELLDENDQLCGVTMEFTGSLEDELSLATLAGDNETESRASDANATMFAHFHFFFSYSVY